MGLKIASRWFERKNVSDGLTLLWEPYAHPLLRCNIWHVRGRDRDLLIDTGLGIASLRDEIADLIDKPLIALATHIHYDHVGSFHEFETRLMHNLEAPLMANYREFCALATDQLAGTDQFNTTGQRDMSVDDNGNLLLHGGYLGVEYLW